ncbi:MAG: polyprenol monophosphomannose synthase [Anaerolineales bacterium]
MNITVVIPTYNEAKNLPNLIDSLFNLPLDINILIVDDHSPDGSGELAEEMAQNSAGRLEVIHRPSKLGLGSAYIVGFKTALKKGAQAVAQMDADFSHPPQKLIEMADALSNVDVAMGSRYIHGGSLDSAWPPWRKSLSRFGNFYARVILGIPIHDVTGGYRLWRSTALERMPLERVRSNGYAFQVEMAYLAYRLGMRFQEIPFYFADRRWGQSKMSWSIQREAAWRVWQLLWEYRDLHRQNP